MTKILVYLRARLLGGLGRTSMYRLVLGSLIVLTVLAFALSFTGKLTAQPVALLVSAAVLLVSVAIVDLIGHRVTGRPVRFESGAITALLLLFLLYPTTDPAGLGVLAVAGAAASASKYLLVWNKRHIFNPAALGAAVVTMTGLASSMWWVGTPMLAGAVLVLGLLIAVRAEKVRVALLFIFVAGAVSFARTLIAAAQFDIDMTITAALTTAFVSSPVLFAGLFMITEPLTLPASRGRQLLVAAVAGAMVGWPVSFGFFVLLPEFAIVLANVLAFFLSTRSGGALTLSGRRMLTPSVVELTFTGGPKTFSPGQYVELEAAHKRVDVRGTRREFSVTSVPGEDLSIAYRVPEGRQSTFKQALEAAPLGTKIATTGIHGDFTLPEDGPVLMIAAGIGVTPFVSQIQATPERDIVLVYVVSSVADLAYRDELAASHARVVVVAPDAAAPSVPQGWRPLPVRLTEDTLDAVVPDLASRHVLLSGPPRLIASITPALTRARSIHTDAFAGY